MNSGQPNSGASSGQGFLPDFCNIRVTFAVVIAAQLLAITLSVASFASADSFWVQLSMLSLFIQWIALASTATLCLLRRWLQPLAAGPSGVLAMLVLLGITALVAHLAYQLAGQHQARIDYLPFMLQSLVISGLIGLLSLHYFYMQYQLAEQQRTEADARFEALQAKIRPHFLFNSMNTIAHLTRTDPGMAEQVVLDLADLFRATLQNNSGESTVARELELARGYLGIEQMRLGSRLQVKWDVDDSLAATPMPAMILQPLLENAVYHGIEPSAEGGQVRVSVLPCDHDICLTISNSVPAQGGRQRQGNRMAQDNVMARLKAVYGERAGFSLAMDDEEYRVRLRFARDMTWS